MSSTVNAVLHWLFLRKAKHIWMCISMHVLDSDEMVNQRLCGSTPPGWWEKAGGHNQEVWFTDCFPHKNWSLNQDNSGRYVGEEAHVIETDSDITGTRNIQTACIYYCQSSKVVHGVLWTLHKAYCLLMWGWRVLINSWQLSLTYGRVSFGEMDEETNTGFHHCHYNALRGLSEQDKGY